MQESENVPVADRLNQKNIQSSGPSNQQSNQLKSRTPPPLSKPQLKKKRHLLSFEEDIEKEEVEEHEAKRCELKKVVNREERPASLEEQLKSQFLKESERMREELVEFQYSYWDGTNVIKKLRRKKRQTVKQILEVCRLELITNFQNLATIEPSELLLVIKDLIVPHQIAIYQLEALSLKTAKNDALLNLRNVKIKKDGKELTLSVNLDGPFRIIEKARYQKNKQVYPFLNWRTLNFKK